MGRLLHRVHALQFAGRNRSAARNLKTGRDKFVLLFDGELARGQLQSDNLARDQKLWMPSGQLLPRQGARQQIVPRGSRNCVRKNRCCFCKGKPRNPRSSESFWGATHQDALPGPESCATNSSTVYCIRACNTPGGRDRCNSGRHFPAPDRFFDFDERQLPARRPARNSSLHPCPAAIPRRESPACRREGPRSCNPSA